MGYKILDCIHVLRQKWHTKINNLTLLIYYGFKCSKAVVKKAVVKNEMESILAHFYQTPPHHPS